MACDAVRLADRVDGVAVEVRYGRAMEFVGGTCVKLHVARQSNHVGTGLLQGFADISGFKLGEVFGVFKDKLADLRKDAATFGGGQAAPVSCKGRFSGGHTKTAEETQ